jgi:hypothetical protein
VCAAGGLDQSANVLTLFKNFAGKIDSNPAKAILFTLQRSFGRCRVLHDLSLEQPDLDNTFVNLVGVTVLVWR